MFKQYIKHKNITALLTDCDIRTNTDSSYGKKNNSQQQPTDTILICNLKTLKFICPDERLRESERRTQPKDVAVN